LKNHQPHLRVVACGWWNYWIRFVRLFPRADCGC
jgi:hypothetical protein